MSSGKNCFEVTIIINNIQDVPLNNEYLYIKVKLADSKFKRKTSSKPIRNHRVEWHEQFEFKTKVKCDKGRLVSKNLKVSVWKEINGGRDSEKLGFFVIDLAERASFSDPEPIKCILNSYKRSRGLEGNSIVSLTTSMRRVSGDPLFKTVEGTHISNLELPGNDSSIDMGNDLDVTCIPDYDDDDGMHEGESQSTHSPSHSVDNVPSAEQLNADRPEYHTQSLDRKVQGKTGYIATTTEDLVRSLKAKSAGSVTGSMVLSSSSISGRGSVSSRIDGHVNKGVRQDSGIGGSHEDQFNTM